MALIAYDGFDQYGSPNDVLGRRGGGLQWNQQNLITVTSPGRNNSPQCIGLGQNAYLYGTLTNPITSGYFGFGVYISTVNYPASPQLRLMDLHAGNNPQLTFVFNIETAGIDVYRNSGNSLDPTTNSVLIASSINNSITLDVWNYVEFFVTIDRTAGAVRIRSNGEDKLNASGLNTQPINQPGHNYFEGMWFFGGGAPCGTTLEIDDFYI